MTKRKKTIGIIVIAIILAGAALTGALFATNAYLDSQYANLHQGCKPNQPVHIVTIKDSVVTPEHTVANKCDTLTIKNLDDVDRMMAFGVHDHHTAYDGVEERELLANQSFTVILTQEGNFKFHDHMHDEVAGTFEVK